MNDLFSGTCLSTCESYYCKKFDSCWETTHTLFLTSFIFLYFSELELNQKALWSENLEEASEFRRVKELAAQLKSEIKFASKGLIEVRAFILT